MAPASQFAEVVLVRHGQTDWNTPPRRVQGRMDQELNETGRQEAAEVARRLSQEAKPAAVHSSDLKRADETARTIAKACLAPDSDVVIDRALTDMDVGSFQGEKIDDVKSSKYYEAFRDDRDHELPGGGESLNQVSKRCVSRVNEIADKYMGQRVVVVSHEIVIQEICRHADPTSSVPSKIPNTSISIIRVYGSDGRWVLEKVGDDGHLTGDGAFGGDGAPV